MKDLDSSQLLTLLSDQHLLEPHQIEEATAAVRANAPPPTDFIEQLCQKGWITRYQAEQLLSGKPDGLILGQYVLIDLLGEGGMGQVFKARHRLMHRLVAIKTIRPEHSKESALPRFLREIRAMSQLIHPNVVIAHDADQVGQSIFLVMEFVDGIDLSKMVKRFGPMPVGPACEAIRQAALGLQHAHEKGLVHRDIKPSNLLLTSDGGVVKVLDLGLARLRGAGGLPADDEPLTASNMLMGTPDYMAPEQARSASAVDIRADLYSLGCTLYYLLTGRPPFPGGAFMEKLSAHAFDPPPPLSDARPDVPPEVEDIYQQLLAKDPADRFQTPAELAEALLPFCSPLRTPSVARPSSEEAPLPDPEVADPHRTVMPGGSSVTARPSSPQHASRTPSPTSPQTGARRPTTVPSRTIAGTRSGSARPVEAPIGGTAVVEPAPEPAPPPRRRGWLLPAAIAVAGLAALGVAGAEIWRNFGPKSGTVVEATRPEDTGPAVPATQPEPTKPAVPSDRPKVVAVITAVKQYFAGAGLTPLPEAFVSAHRIEESLQAACGDSVLLFVQRLGRNNQTLEQAPTLQHIDRELRNARDICKPTDTFVFVWAGDVIRRDDGCYLCPTHGRPDDPTTLLKLDNLYARVREIPAGSRVIISEVGRGEKLARPQDVPVPEGVTVLFAAEAWQKAQDQPGEKGESLFLKAVGEGLFDATQPLDRFVREYVSELSKGEQTPQRLGRATGSPLPASLTGLRSPPAPAKGPPMVVEPPPDKPGFVSRVGKHEKAVVAVAFLGDTEQAVGADESKLRVWDTKKGKEVFSDFGDTEGLFWCVAALRDGKSFFTGEGRWYHPQLPGKKSQNMANFITLRQTGRVTPLQDPWNGHKDNVLSLALGPGDGTLASSGADGVVVLWDAKKGKGTTIATFRGHGSSPADSVAISPDGRLIADGDRLGRVIVWRPTTAAGQVEKEIKEAHASSVSGIAFDESGDRLLTVGRDGKASVYDANNFEQLRHWEAHSGMAVRGVAPLPGRRLVTVGEDGFLRVWDYSGTAAKEVGAYSAGSDPKGLTCLSVSADGKRAVTGDTEGYIRLWNLPPAR